MFAKSGWAATKAASPPELGLWISNSSASYVPAGALIATCWAMAVLPSGNATSVGPVSNSSQSPLPSTASQAAANGALAAGAPAWRDVTEKLNVPPFEVQAPSATAGATMTSFTIFIRPSSTKRQEVNDRVRTPADGGGKGCAGRRGHQRHGAEHAPVTRLTRRAGTGVANRRTPVRYEAAEATTAPERGDAALDGIERGGIFIRQGE